MHHGYSLFHRKPRPKFEIEALFRLVMLYTDTKKYTPHCMIKAKKYSSRYYCIGTHDIKTIINNQIHIVGSLINSSNDTGIFKLNLNIQMNLNRSFYFQKGLSFCADNDIFSSSRSLLRRYNNYTIDMASSAEDYCCIFIFGWFKWKKPLSSDTIVHDRREVVPVYHEKCLREQVYISIFTRIISSENPSVLLYETRKSQIFSQQGSDTVTLMSDSPTSGVYTVYHTCYNRNIKVLIKHASMVGEITFFLIGPVSAYIKLNKVTIYYNIFPHTHQCELKSKAVNILLNKRCYMGVKQCANSTALGSEVVAFAYFLYLSPKFASQF
ncbi:hypothetical protein AGLY_018278 [Aphis glycines]|uniref:Uncharacterized protein n=1 Tax=Aphis glycines TaxID=307491 RepID=A0A6G0SSF5_APHGL|nr:hypothetical protein AGLY_018278 [Aphis glycines]